MVATSAGEEKFEMGAVVREEQSLRQKDLVLQVPSQVLNPKPIITTTTSNTMQLTSF
jgi:hypothetical protein